MPGPRNSDERMETLAITLPSSLKRQLEDASWKLRLNRSEITRRALAEWLQREVKMAVTA